MKVETAVCVTCQGTGKCPRCGGDGHVGANIPRPSVVSERLGSTTGLPGVGRICSECIGSGTCQTCHGSGKA